jgi:hypothetical protein
MTLLSNATGPRGVACTKSKICTSIHRHRLMTPAVIGSWWNIFIHAHPVRKRAIVESMCTSYLCAIKVFFSYLFFEANIWSHKISLLRGFLPERKLFFHIQKKQKFKWQRYRTYSTKNPARVKTCTLYLDRRIYLSSKIILKLQIGDILLKSIAAALSWEFLHLSETLSLKVFHT